jgi:NAD(P)-dependent dehydrogenase (short-subunit alcohol dehydrogenase family)
MSKTILIFGYGTGISKAIALKFGKEGYACALVARNADRLTAAVAELAQSGITAHAFPADLGSVAAVKDVVGAAHGKLGGIGAIHWNAYSGAAGDVLAAPPEDLTAAIGLATTSLLAAVQAALPDLKANKGAILVTNGGLGFFDAQVDKMGVDWNCMGLSVANSAKHKLCALLAHKLAGDGVYVGEIMVTGTVKGTAFDQGNANLDPGDIAAKFWSLAQARTDHTATM